MLVEPGEHFTIDSWIKEKVRYKKMKDKLTLTNIRPRERRVRRVKNDINMVAVSLLFTTFTPTFIIGR